MGNDSSTPTDQNDIIFHNCSSTSFQVSDKSGAFQVLSKGNQSCGMIAFYYETSDFVLTGDNGQIYTLLGSTMQSLDYTNIFIWEDIVPGSDIYSDKFMDNNSGYTGGSYLSPGLHVSFNNQSITALVKDNNGSKTVSQIDFSSVFIYNNPPITPVQPPVQDNPPVQDPVQDPDTPQVHHHYYLLVLFIAFMVLIIVVVLIILKTRGRGESGLKR